MSAKKHEVEVLRGEIIDSVLEKDLRRMWAHTAGIEGDEATERLPNVVCVLRGPDGRPAGVNSVRAAEVGLIADRPFWVYESLLPGRSARYWAQMFNAAFEVLAAGFAPNRPGPVGLFAPIAEQPLLECREAVWEDTGLLYAGYLADGRQGRLRYFDYALI
jgi:hypothetical protein